MMVAEVQTSGGTAQVSPTAADVTEIARRLYVDGPWLRRKFQHWRPFICPFETLVGYVRPGSSVLDVGCGQGLFLGVLTRLGLISSGLGFDTSARAIESAVQMARGNDGVGRVVCFERLEPGQWPAGIFDVVSMIDVMHHVPSEHRREMIHAACDRVAPGGVLLYKDMCPRPRWRATMNGLHDLIISGEIVHHEPPENVEAWVAEAGFKSVESRRIDRLWYGHDLRVFSRGAA